MGKELYKSTLKCEPPDLVVSCGKRLVKFEIPQTDVELDNSRSSYATYVKFDDFDKIMMAVENVDNLSGYDANLYFKNREGEKMALEIYLGNPFSAVRILETDFYLTDMKSAIVKTKKFKKTLTNVKNAIRMHKVGKQDLNI